MLLSSGADFEMATPVKQLRPLHLAASVGALEVVKSLLSRGADPLAATVDGRCAHAFGEHNSELHKLVYSAMREAMKARGQMFVWSKLAAAAKVGDALLLNRLLREGVDPNSHDGVFTALQLACKHGQEEIVCRLIEAGSHINRPAPGTDRFGVTALHVAARAGRLKITRALLEAKADPSLPDLGGQLPVQATGRIKPIMGEARGSSRAALTSQAWCVARKRSIRKAPGAEGEATCGLLKGSLNAAAIHQGALRGGEEKRRLYCMLLPNRLLMFADETVPSPPTTFTLIAARRRRQHRNGEHCDANTATASRTRCSHTLQLDCCQLSLPPPRRWASYSTTSTWLQ